MEKPKNRTEAALLIHEIEKNFNLHVVIWNPEDVIQQAENNNTPITIEESYKCIWLLSKYHDCNYGTTWDSLDSIIDMVIEDRVK